MVCPNCNKETNGIKLNGKIFCNFCGEVIKDTAEILEEYYQSNVTDDSQGKGKGSSEASEKAQAKIIVSDITAPRKQKSKRVNTAITASNGLVIAVGKPPRKSTKRNIKGGITKHQRPRTDHLHFDLVRNEPNPIEEPELEAPHDLLVKESNTIANTPKTPKTTNFSLLSQESKKKISENRNKKQSVLADYLRQTSGIEQSRVKRKKLTRKKRILALVSIFMFVVLILIVLASIIYAITYLAVNPFRGVSF